MAPKAEAMFIVIAGVMAVTTAITSYRNMNAMTFQVLVVGAMNKDVVTLCCMALTLIGLFNVGIGFFKGLHSCSMSFNQYVTVVVFTLIANFAIGMILTDYKTEILQNLEPSLLKQLKELSAVKDHLEVGLTTGEAWDYMQVKMMCCGVNGYKDYLEIDSRGSNSGQLVPVTCCSMKPLHGKPAATDSMLPVPDSLAQCQLDAKMSVVSSAFLNTQGCLDPLSRWTIRMINKMLAMVFCMICLQALGVFHISWLGFRRSLSRQRGNSVSF